MFFYNNSKAKEVFMEKLLSFKEEDFEGMKDKNSLMLYFEDKTILGEGESDKVIKEILNSYGEDKVYYTNLELLDIVEHEEAKDFYGITYLSTTQKGDYILSGIIVNLSEEYGSFKLKHFNLFIKEEDLGEYIERMEEEVERLKDELKRSKMKFAKNIILVRLSEALTIRDNLKLIKEEI